MKEVIRQSVVTEVETYTYGTIAVEQTTVSNNELGQSESFVIKDSSNRLAIFHATRERLADLLRAAEEALR